MPTEWKVGDQLWLEVAVRSRKSRYTTYATVTKVGRKWLTLDADLGYLLHADKISLERHPANVAPWFRLWATREECEEHERNQSAWSQLRKQLSRTSDRPDDITADAIEQAAKLLGIKLGGE